MVESVLTDMYQVFFFGFATGLFVCSAGVLIGFTVRKLAAIFHK